MAMNIDDVYPPSLRLMIEQQQQLQKQFELPASIRALVDGTQPDGASIKNLMADFELPASIRSVLGQHQSDMASIGINSMDMSSVLSQDVAETTKLLQQAGFGDFGIGKMDMSSMLNQGVAETTKLLQQATFGDFGIGKMDMSSMLNQDIAERKLLQQATFGNFGIGKMEIASWQSIAESILGNQVEGIIGNSMGLVTAAHALESAWGWNQVDLLNIARTFDYENLDDDDDESTEPTTSADHIVIPSDRALILVGAQISDLLLARFARHPEELTRISPRKFEELIAGLFEGFGYEVELTAQTRDGGYDIVAVRRAETTTRSLIECKRNSAENKVGVGVVRQLRGVLASENATNGIVATTATFTRDAQRFIAANQWQIEGRTINGVVDWINRYLRR
jgi:hypothetical protein